MEILEPLLLLCMYALSPRILRHYGIDAFCNYYESNIEYLLDWIY